MIKHDNNADYHRLGGGIAASFDEEATHPVLLVDDHTEQTLAALSAEQALNFYEHLRTHRSLLKKLKEASNEHTGKQ